MIPGDSPIGLFDSGVGGLTILRALRRRFPGQSLLYFADQRHVPYGDREPDEVRRLALAITHAMIAAGCRAVVMACNISSATALEAAEAIHAPTPVVGVVRPAVRLAVTACQAGSTRIGVLATQGTVQTGVYPREILRAAPSASVVQVACPAFVPLVEAGVFEGSEVSARCHEYLEPLARAECDPIVLGCTHYPFLLPALRQMAAELFERPPLFIDPADAVVDELTGRLALAATHGRKGVALYTSGDPHRFRAQVQLLLDARPLSIGQAIWCDERLQWDPGRAATPSEG